MLSPAWLARPGRLGLRGRLVSTPMAVKRLRLRIPLPRTLRGRLIAGLVALLAVACATVGLVTYFAVQGALSRELNGELQTATSLAYNCWQRQDSDDKVPQPASGQGSTAKSGSASAGQGGTGPASAAAHTTAWLGGPGTSDTPGSSPSDAAGTHSESNEMGECQGLGEQTFVADVSHGQWGQCVLVGERKATLSAADKKTLASLTQVPTEGPGGMTSGHSVPTSTRYLSVAKGTFELTAVRDTDSDSVYITGLPLAGLHDTLGDVALAEAAVFGAVLVLAGVFGTFWVRFSLRPLRRVASTASQVAELPLETGEVSLPAGVPDTDPATETGQVGLAFNRMLGHVETALRRRAASEIRLRRFAADASHELRTPLAAIRGYAELALRHPGDAPEDVTHALGRVLSESTRMSVLVDDLLLLARLDAGRPLNSESVDMTRLVIDATSDAQVARPGHRWVLELPDDPELVLGDEHRLRQVLGNLLSNAGRHTPDGTTVTVRVCNTLPDGEPGSDAESLSHGTLPPAPRLVISVTDDGPGIPADLLPDLFERFTRADTSRSHAGDASSTGLGLAIVDAVVTAHHGAVLVTSRPGMTRFTIVLGRLAMDAAPEPARTARRLPAPVVPPARRGRRRGYSGVGTGSTAPAAVLAPASGASAAVSASGATGGSGPPRSSAPTTTAPPMKMPMHHQNTVV
jgi:two-component system, OmpR family, sensor kinase